MKAKKISFLVLAMGCIAVMAITSCSKSNSGGGGGTTVVTIGGYVSSDSVAASSLVAYWPMDGNGNDTKGGQTGTVNGGSFTTGIRGQAYQGDTTGTYISSGVSSAVAGLQSYTWSAWIKSPAAGKKPTYYGHNTHGTTAQGIFFLGSSTNGSYGNELIVESDNLDSVQFTNDTLALHWGFNDPGGVTSPSGWNPLLYVMTSSPNDTSSIGWEHVVMSYDGSSSTFVGYWNATPISVSSAFGKNLSTTMLNGAVADGGVPLANLSFASAAPDVITIGAWPAYGVFGLNNTNSFAGTIDEMRIYNRALTQQEITGLYLNGRAGR
ncbi:MAG TPA: LamG-like jellyroll fold domain-containing protein [Puia sp.]|jgi:hypothetical protein|nr:LamG-like jellyroll fold domain-containing protein [Puia sp.]